MNSYYELQLDMKPASVRTLYNFEIDLQVLFTTANKVWLRRGTEYIVDEKYIAY